MTEVDFYHGEDDYDLSREKKRKTTRLFGQFVENHPKITKMHYLSERLPFDGLPLLEDVGCPAIDLELLARPLPDGKYSLYCSASNFLEIFPRFFSKDSDLLKRCPGTLRPIKKWVHPYQSILGPIEFVREMPYLKHVR